ncbi:MAG TPA: hypothetical protein GXX70_00730 [Tepidimicrobium sp.]|nr:hypothetical protein [Tepidimicrobium sp.]
MIIAINVSHLKLRGRNLIIIIGAKDTTVRINSDLHKASCQLPTITPYSIEYGSNGRF